MTKIRGIANFAKNCGKLQSGRCYKQNDKTAEKSIESGSNMLFIFVATTS